MKRPEFVNGKKPTSKPLIERSPRSRESAGTKKEGGNLIEEREEELLRALKSRNREERGRSARARDRKHKKKKNKEKKKRAEADKPKKQLSELLSKAEAAASKKLQKLKTEEAAAAGILLKQLQREQHKERSSLAAARKKAAEIATAQAVNCSRKLKQQKNTTAPSEEKSYDFFQ
ncbi:hypothetical protein M9H77_29683 [Catharanthus roseus]|uniref:Uncharacterized protein n=1 Tax=Catharanthus roseus TaxID=4058 RepID=A0ACB9ZVH1_CATRO|nr:hypothetical protein M9H77_29683 [Catharanthus roseus]